MGKEHDSIVHEPSVLKGPSEDQEDCSWRLSIKRTVIFRRIANLGLLLVNARQQAEGEQSVLTPLYTAQVGAALLERTMIQAQITGKLSQGGGSALQTLPPCGGATCLGKGSRSAYGHD
eukprot:1918722-Amphidinium_carterae.1